MLLLSGLAFRPVRPIWNACRRSSFGGCIEADTLMHSRQNVPSTPARSEPIPSSASASAIHEIDAPAGGPAAFEPREQFIRGFLRGIQPGMEDLTQNFMSAGVVNKMCLVSLAGMPNWEKDKLLRDDMSLTPFQVRAVRVGLAGLQA